MADIEKIAEELSNLTVLEAAELAKLLEDKWGVSAAAAPVAMAMPCLLYTSPSPRDQRGSRMPSSA